jgi:hypothetical protein
MSDPVPPPSVELSPPHLDALRNLSRKRAGFDVGWIAIAEAVDLTERGLAVRDRSGWHITAEGEAALAAQGVPGGAAAILPFHAR